ncbi:MAG TPA: cytochrome C oxidase subunit IV family protein [Oxalicibacterium sp.]|nr:cytochrome C oxidase subunit IV family protein [Oxalicibacterium sp.]
MHDYKRQLLIWASLMLLLAATFSSAWLELGFWNTFINFAIAALKAALVVFFFMHLRRSSRSIRVAAFVALFMIGLLFIVSGSDYVTRHVDGAPWQAPQQLSSIDRAHR